MARGVALLSLVSARPAVAQISPGPLTQAHADLEGSAGCPRCHEPGKGVSPERCLECHTALAARLAARLGLHAQPGYAECARCHIEHHGRDVDLVWWGEAGRSAFDHALTGYPLEGRHRQARCEACHDPERIADPQALKAGAANPQRSYLGLGTTCTACHADVHRGQLAEACETCHGLDVWRPAPGFDHARARYSLEGAHAAVACERCHPLAGDAGASYVRYRDVPFATCSGCHADPHAGRLGADCERCHDVRSWRTVPDARFDHDRTAYPLEGRHASVRCEACHRGRRAGRLAHAACTDCHQDAHRGELKDRADAGRCEACHDVLGFVPARYSAEDHAKSRYPLSGAHLAVPCDRCHVRRTGGGPAVLRPAAGRCPDCHADPHLGGASGRNAQRACTACHVVDSWRRIGFDHSATDYGLERRHAQVPCIACHPEDEARPGWLAFTPRPRDCAGCHVDAHAGQFERDGVTDCRRCHDVQAWRPAAGFDHGRDAAWVLDGAHARVACARCHPVEPHGDRRVVRYRPVPHRCGDCHAGGAP